MITLADGDAEEDAEGDAKGDGETRRNVCDSEKVDSEVEMKAKGRGKERKIAGSGSESGRSKGRYYMI